MTRPAINPAVYDQIWKSNIAKSRKIEDLERRLANQSFSLDRARKRIAELEEELRAARDRQHAVARTASWGAL